MIYLSDSYVILKKLDLVLKNQQIIFDLLVHIERKVSAEMSDLSVLTAEVQANTSVDSSAITLLNGLSAQLALIANDPVAIQALADELNSSSTALAAAVVANTPVVETPPVDVPPVDSPPVDSPPVS